MLFGKPRSTITLVVSLILEVILVDVENTNGDAIRHAAGDPMLPVMPLAMLVTAALEQQRL